MKEIEQIYFNDFGVSFYWRKNDTLLTDRIQVIFRETGFYFTREEVQRFACIVNEMYDKNHCGGCGFRNKCHRFLLKTPVSEIDLAVSVQELVDIKDLLEGTLFTMNLNEYINNVCKN
ncbi:hypothetical protein [Flavobacterium sp. C4GT6]|uniref:hypothetical protein n=1 Tax=Flavobacterium sp. C4GT6 TaxID=3103818 RepID=UPI002ED3EA2C